MERLMYLCRNSEKEGCHPYVIENKKKIKSSKKENRDENTDIWLTKEILKKLDEICKECKSRFFLVEEKECPVCGSKDLKETKGFLIFNGGIKIREDSFIICKRCETLLKYVKFF